MVPIKVPALGDRLEDVPALVEYFVATPSAGARDEAEAGHAGCDPPRAAPPLARERAGLRNAIMERLFMLAVGARSDRADVDRVLPHGMASPLDARGAAEPRQSKNFNKTPGGPSCWSAA